MNNIGTIEKSDAYQYHLYKAKSTLLHFNDLIKNKTPYYNAVKFKNEENVYVWLENVMIEDNFYLGILSENNEPHKISVDDAIDWMIIENGRLIGGYTIRYYRSTLDEEERINFDIDFGVIIDEGNDYFKPSLQTPEGAIIKIENFYSEENLEGVLSCKNFLMEAENLLRERDALITQSNITEIADAIKLSFIEDLQINGFPTFNDIERNFTLKREIGNLRLIEEKVIYRNGNTSFNNLWVGLSKEREWKVLNLVE